MSRGRVTLRTWLLLALLVAIAGTWAFTHVRDRALRAELEELAAEAATLMAEVGWRQPDQPAKASVTIARKYVIFGPVTGKVTVFVKNIGPDGTPAYGEYNAFYTREAGAWLRAESGFCSGNECRIRAAEALGQ
ncbi:MAG: hypothetical protein JXR94_15385 [Candidatus Hydrogenedentes bacterium]|nr:hypothetical protein [Candidatus Hydrogenedentota bacterium]